MTASYTIPDPPTLTNPFVQRVLLSAIPLVPRDFGRFSGQRIMVGLSGGPDSCALLAVMRALEWPIIACHVNHNLRGAESDEDAQFCLQLCKSWGVQFISHKLAGDIRDEARLRDARYGIFATEAARLNCTMIATGHNANDQAETVLFRMIRGTSALGLQGIPDKRSLNESTTLIRPLLEIARADIETFLKEIGLQPRIDSTNKHELYARNYIREKVIPVITERFPDAVKSITRMRTLNAEDEEYLASIAAQATDTVVNAEGVWNVVQLLVQPKSIQRRLIAAALRERGVEVTFERVRAILKLCYTGSGAVNLNSWWRARAYCWPRRPADVEAIIDEKIELRFEYTPDVVAEDEVDALTEPAQPCELSPSGITVCSPLSVCVNLDPIESAENASAFPPPDAAWALVDLSRCVQPLVVRMRQPGDRITPFGMQESVKLKKYLHTHKSSAQFNPSRSIVIADADEVVWVPGVGISERLRVSDKPTHRIEFRRLS